MSPEALRNAWHAAIAAYSKALSESPCDESGWIWNEPVQLAIARENLERAQQALADAGVPAFDTEDVLFLIAD